MSPLLRTGCLAPLVIMMLAGAAKAESVQDGGVDAGAESDSDGHDRIIIRTNPDDRVSIGGSITVQEPESVADAVAVGGSLTALGHVRGDAVCIGGTLRAGPHAVIDGDAVVIGGSLDADTSARIKGSRVVIGSLMGLGGLAGLAGAIGSVAAIWFAISALISILGLIAFGALFIAFIPERLDRMRTVALAQPLAALGVGLAAFVGIIPASVLLIVSIIGILILPFLWMLFGLVIALGLTIVAQHLGERLLRGTRFAGPIPCLALGALLLTLARAVPFVGTLVFVGALILGAGAVILARLGATRPPASPSLPMAQDPMPPSEVA